MSTAAEYHNVVMDVPILVGGYYTFIDRLYVYGAVGPDIFFFSRSYWDAEKTRRPARLQGRLRRRVPRARGRRLHGRQHLRRGPRGALPLPELRADGRDRQRRRPRGLGIGSGGPTTSTSPGSASGSTCGSSRCRARCRYLWTAIVIAIRRRGRSRRRKERQRPNAALRLLAGFAQHRGGQRGSCAIERAMRPPASLHEAQ